MYYVTRKITKFYCYRTRSFVAFSSVKLNSFRWDLAWLIRKLKFVDRPESVIRNDIELRDVSHIFNGEVLRLEIYVNVDNFNFNGTMRDALITAKI